MKIKNEFWMREVGGTCVAVPVGASAKQNRVIVNLNGSGALLFKLLQNGTDKEALCKALTDEYDVDSATAQKSVDDFLCVLTDADMLDE